MANNIKIVGNILNTSTFTRYSEEDIRLISSKKRQELFGGQNDYIEYFTYDIEGNLLNNNYNYLDYKLPSSSFLSPIVSIIPNTTGQIQTADVGIISTIAPTGSSLYPIIEIDPIQDLQDLGYSSGEFRVRYNFFEKKISNNIDQELFVKEISRDRTEIRLGSVTLTDEQIESGSLALIDKINNTEDYYVDYLLNFGDNQQYVAVNVALNKNPEGYEILFKLYESLPPEIQEKQTLWIVEEKVIPYTFDINLDKLIVPPPPPTLRGPNFDIEIEGQGTVSTAYNSYSNLISSLQSLQSSSYNQIQSLITSQSIDINIDYSNFNNFVFFGSAYQRVVNFYNKVKEIEFYQSEINTLGPTASTTASLQTVLNQYSASINNIIAEFDGLEYYLYFNSGSFSTLPGNYSITPYPKSGSLLPYTLLPSSNSTVTTWYNNTLENALEYDRNNYDNLEYAIPLFIKDDEKNQPFLLFLNMVGHYFDNIWIYLKAITDINQANNNLDYGISRDLVYQQLKSLGIKLYNSQAGEGVDNYLIGANTGSVLWNNDFSPTSSYLNNIPRKDLVAELYKRIYHNLPLLAKTKGTVAGLNNLMTTFGIPNRTYYTVGSESFYTPTGSASTASILNVKEFGGSLKSELVNGYNNDKVRIIQNTITGSVLSPLLSLQTFPTASSAFRDDDLHYVDISFSPQTQIDTRTSLAIASNAPTWSIDDYIGDPSQLYSGSYPDLDTQRTLYYQTGISGYPGFTSSLLDYNGFIRLIEFFDNSLFKMLNDFVPERTSLSTGVTINSPVLERNKAAYARPTVTTQSVYEADYRDASGEISSQYGTFYNALSASNNTKAWYDGDISGSVVDVNQYFEDNYNPYLQPTASLTSTDVNFFNHSDWNVLLNNVSKSIDSQYRRKIEYFYGTTGSITSSAELQDSYLSLRSYNTSRYEGSKLTSLLINTYTSASYTGSDGFTIQTGDKSFGKTAVIDRNSIKVGWVKNFQSSSLNFNDKTSITLKYLVDANQSLIELNQRNANLFEVQNTFKSGNNVVVSLSDILKPSFQKTLDGSKKIFRGGFSYDPILFREGNEVLNFLFPGGSRNREVFLGYKGMNLSYGYFYQGDIVRTQILDNISQAPGGFANRIGSEPGRNPFLTGYTVFEFSTQTVDLLFRFQAFRGTLPATTGTKYIGSGREAPDAILANPPAINQVPWDSKINNINLSDAPNVKKSAIDVSWGTGLNRTLSIAENNPGRTFVQNGITVYKSPIVDNQQGWGYELNKNNAYVLDIKVREIFNVKFNNYDEANGGYYTEQANVRPSEDIVFKATREGTYRASMKFPIAMTVGYYARELYSFFGPNTPYQDQGVSFKAFFALEKKANGSENWNIIGHTYIKSISAGLNNVQIDQENNVFHFVGGQGTGGYYQADSLRSLRRDVILQFYNPDPNLRSQEVVPIFFDLDVGDELRLKFYLIDLDIFSGVYGRDFGMDFAGPNSALGSFFEIIDPFTPILATNQTVPYSEISTLSAQGNRLLFSEKVSDFFVSTSIFVPSGSTAGFYSTIVDNVSVQKDDLIRIGAFKDPESTYFNVIDSNIGYPTGIEDGNTLIPPTVNNTYVGVIFRQRTTFTTRNIIELSVAQGVNENAFSFFRKILDNPPGLRQFTITNVSPSNITGLPTVFTITNIANFNRPYNGISIPLIEITVQETVPNTLANFSPTFNPAGYWTGGVRCNFVSPTILYAPRIVATLDRPIPSNIINISQNFAILRPKPDETSVIVDFKKFDGDVSQAILIPDDANKAIKDKVGDIYKALNTDLSQQQTQ